MTSNQSAAAKPPDGSSDVDPLTPSSIDAPVLDPVPPPAPPSLLAEPAESVAAVAASSSTRSLRPSGLGRSLRPGGAALRPGGAGRGYKGGAGSNTDYSAGAAGSGSSASAMDIKYRYTKDEMITFKPAPSATFPSHLRVLPSYQLRSLVNKAGGSLQQAGVRPPAARRLFGPRAGQRWRRPPRPAPCSRQSRLPFSAVERRWRAVAEAGSTRDAVPAPAHEDSESFSQREAKEVQGLCC
jgi:hypothetical protein